MVDSIPLALLRKITLSLLQVKLFYLFMFSFFILQDIINVREANPGGISEYQDDVFIAYLKVLVSLFCFILFVFSCLKLLEVVFILFDLKKISWVWFWGCINYAERFRHVWLLLSSLYIFWLTCYLRKFCATFALKRQKRFF